jgi:hypothetical protein
LEDASRAYAFDGDPALFRLAAEALRIRMAALFDPMLAVKGRAGAEDFSVTRSEVLYGKNADRYRLALVSVSPDGPEHDEVRLLDRPVQGRQLRRLRHRLGAVQLARDVVPRR